MKMVDFVEARYKFTGQCRAKAINNYIIISYHILFISWCIIFVANYVL